MNKKITGSIIILGSASILLLLIEIRNGNLLHWLEPTRPVNANILIIEGWLPDRALELAKTEVQKKDYELIVPTGIQSAELDFCMIAMNGYLIFYPDQRYIFHKETGRHKIEVVARSKMKGEKYKSHFNFFVNDSIAGDYSADEIPRKYAVSWNRPLNELDSISVQFTNDYVDKYGDRNLYVSEMIIDNEIVIPYNFNSVFDPGSLGGKDRIINNYVSHPEIIRKKLIESGFDPSRIIAVTGKKTNINRTLAGAVAFRDWLKLSGYKAEGVNIVTMGIHARRTWLTYRKVLGRSVQTGIIALPNTETIEPDNQSFKSVFAEFMDLIYYHIILPFH
ncbi:MAG: carbohydrate-binding domain-containing protein [Bacteroidota bacterium]|nr:carbohydrate-binding domain-containing protein [Bacteroidota bacterium]